MKYLLATASFLLAICLIAPAQANIIASEDFDGGAVNLNSFTTSANVPAGGFTSAGDGFGVYTRLVSTSIPFNLSDDSVTGGAAGSGNFPPDNNGPVGNAKNNDGVFGITDTWNADTGNTEVTGTWSFDISSATLPLLAVGIDMVAMNDFAGSTVNSNVDFFYQIDGGGFFPLFTSSIDIGSSQFYTMDSGLIVQYTDPLIMTPADRGGTQLSDDFYTLTSAFAGSGTTLEIQVRVNMDGSESFAMDNITISSVPEPSTIGLLALAGVFAIRRRRN